MTELLAVKKVLNNIFFDFTIGVIVKEVIEILNNELSDEEMEEFIQFAKDFTVKKLEKKDDLKFARLKWCYVMEILESDLERKDVVERIIKKTNITKGKPLLYCVFPLNSKSKYKQNTVFNIHSMKNREF